jgi:hypothetical protein
VACGVDELGKEFVNGIIVAKIIGLLHFDKEIFHNFVFAM